VQPHTYIWHVKEAGLDLQEAGLETQPQMILSVKQHHAGHVQIVNKSNSSLMLYLIASALI